MPGEWATIVPMQSADPRLRVTPAANVAPKISDRDVENSAAGPRATGTQVCFSDRTGGRPFALSEHMTRVVSALILLGMSLLSNAGSAQSSRTATPALVIDSLTGRDSFDRYCAACHGADGRGAGPVASSLKVHPADLTTLAERNGGSFPRRRVASFVEGTGRPLPAHGTSDMPVWGATFRGLESSEARVKARLANLVAYVESLQRSSDGSPRNLASASLTGAQLFRTHCASCHGETGQGTGPLSTQLARPVPDVTTYTARNGGVFPGERLRQIIAGRGPAAHGDRTMPVWGDVFKRQASASDTDDEARIDALVAFLQSIQQRGAE
jgi:mono/diheme cytochrome c family protein